MIKSKEPYRDKFHLFMIIHSQNFYQNYITAAFEMKIFAKKLFEGLARLKIGFESDFGGAIYKIRNNEFCTTYLFAAQVTEIICNNFWI